MTAAFAVAMALVLAGTGLLLYTRLDSHLALAIDRQLRLRAQDLTALVAERGSSLEETSGTFVEHGESYAQLLDAGGRVLDASPPLTDAPLLDRAELEGALVGTVFTNRDAVPGLDEPSRILATPVQRDDRTLVLVVGTTREERAETLARLRTELLIVGPIALVLASLAGYALAGLALRPVESMRARAATISAETTGERLPVPRTGDEIQLLGETLNEMLDRLETALERERDFVADAGHELRTPLALLRTDLELTLRHGSSTDELRETVVASVAEVDRLSQLAEDLLVIARFDRGRLPLRVEALDATDLLGSVARRFEWRAREEGRPIVVEPADGATVHGDRIRLEQALGNMVENALRHGDGEVRLSASAVGGSVVLRVTDEGPGFPATIVGKEFERFTRGDTARARGGTGLGLSIVQVIAKAHGGAAAALNRPGGGADVWLTLPADPTAAGDTAPDYS